MAASNQSAQYSTTIFILVALYLSLSLSLIDPNEFNVLGFFVGVYTVFL